jgi:hypothetical protein
MFFVVLKDYNITIECPSSSIPAGTYFTCILKIINTVPGPFNIVLNSTANGAATTNLLVWTNLTTVANTNTTNLTTSPIMFMRNDTYKLMAIMPDMATSGSAVYLEQYILIQVTPVYNTALSLNPSTISTDLTVGQSVQVNLLAWTAGALVSFSVDFGDNTTFYFSLCNWIQVIGKFYIYPGVYLLKVTGMNLLSMTFNVTGQCLCTQPILDISNRTNLITSPQIINRSTKVNISAMIWLNCSYNYTLTKQWSMIQVNQTTASPIGSSLNLTNTPFSGYNESCLVALANSLPYGTYQLTLNERRLLG